MTIKQKEIESLKSANELMINQKVLDAAAHCATFALDNGLAEMLSEIGKCMMVPEQRDFEYLSEQLGRDATDQEIADFENAYVAALESAS